MLSIQVLDYNVAPSFYVNSSLMFFLFLAVPPFPNELAAEAFEDSGTPSLQASTFYVKYHISLISAALK